MAETKGAVVLVVDDNPATRYSTARVLRAGGMEVLEAGTGQECLDQAGDHVGLVVLDVNLPDMDGFEVCRRLRERPETRRLFVLHLSASHVGEADKAYGLDVGADGYLTHPVEPIVLVATVRAFLRTRAAEEHMRRSEAKFKAVFDEALSGIALLDEKLRFLSVNRALCELLGRGETDLEGASALDVLHSIGPDKIARIDDALATQGKWQGLVQAPHADGRLLDLEWQLSLHSEPGIRLAVINDITQRRRYESEREELLAREQAARAEAEQANRLKDEFLATVSHELRNPISSVYGWAELLRQKYGGDNSSLAEGLAAIERGAQVQGQLISDLLDISSIVSGKFRLETAPLDCRSVVEAAIDVVTPSARGKQIGINRSLGRQPSLIVADADRLQQIVWNLLSNAIKFTPRGGQIDVALEKTHSRLQLTVRDNGRGIEPEFLPFVFDRFRQAESGSRKGSAGLGLGLSIVKHLVEMHGGSVEAQSEGRDRGALFQVSLPLASLAEEVREEVADRPRVRLDGVRILVVEDDEASRQLMRHVLGDAGALVADADGVAEAMALLDDFRPQLLLSDIGMSPEDGYDLIRKVRMQGYSPQQLPALALTAFTRKEDRHQILRAGFQAHLHKPVDLQELLAALASFSGRHQ